MRLMGLDLGDKTIGVSISDETGLIAQSLCIIRRKSLNDDLKRLEEIVKEKVVNKIVIGLPKNMNNTIGERGDKSIKFAEILKEHFKEIEIILWDERLSTVSAERVLLEANIQRRKRRTLIDKVAASFILQNYLDSQS